MYGVIVEPTSGRHVTCENRANLPVSVSVYIETLGMRTNSNQLDARHLDHMAVNGQGLW